MVAQITRQSSQRRRKRANRRLRLGRRTARWEALELLPLLDLGGQSRSLFRFGDEFFQRFPLRRGRGAEAQALELIRGWLQVPCPQEEWLRSAKRSWLWKGSICTDGWDEMQPLLNDASLHYVAPPRDVDFSHKDLVAWMATT
jgi:hypothetical protein